MHSDNSFVYQDRKQGKTSQHLGWEFPHQQGWVVISKGSSASALGEKTSGLDEGLEEKIKNKPKNINIWLGAPSPTGVGDH